MGTIETAGTVGSSVQRTSHARIERSVTNFACEHRVERLCGAASGLPVGAARPPRARRLRRRSDASPVGPRAEERRKAVELITRVFPGAEVKTQGSSSLGQVIIKHNATTVIAVKQRDLFSKYRWPAAPKILERLEMLKEDLED